MLVVLYVLMEITKKSSWQATCTIHMARYTEMCHATNYSVATPVSVLCYYTGRDLLESIR